MDTSRLAETALSIPVSGRRRLMRRLRVTALAIKVHMARIWYAVNQSRQNRRSPCDCTFDRSESRKVGTRSLNNGGELLTSQDVAAGGECVVPRAMPAARVRLKGCCAEVDSFEQTLCEYDKG
jgi:hypothetical protein